jgi:hypothetical protein|tara:strand:+ start:2298 stop:2990 length:693 start_codon:yes stop_codon:yes gene_type:complete
MSKDPAFLFYSSDFLTGTMFLSDEQTGRFIKLLCVQHQKGRLSEKHMLNICKTYDKDVFEMFTKDDKGLFYNERLEFEHNKRKSYSESRRSNRTKKKKDVINISKTYDQHMENENRNENINAIEVEIYPTFSDFWNLYQKKGNKKLSKKRWDKLTYKIKEQIMDYVPAYVRSEPEEEFRKNAESFIYQEAWNNKIIIKSKNNGRAKNNRSEISEEFANEIIAGFSTSKSS